MNEDETERRSTRISPFDEERNRTALDKAFPDEQSGTRRDILKPMITRWTGSPSNYYDALGYVGYQALWGIIEQKVQAQLKHTLSDGNIKADFQSVFKDPILENIGLYSISLGGKGRREAVELGKVSVPGESPSRWSWRRRD